MQVGLDPGNPLFCRSGLSHCAFTRENALNTEDAGSLRWNLLPGLPPIHEMGFPSKHLLHFPPAPPCPPPLVRVLKTSSYCLGPQVSQGRKRTPATGCVTSRRPRAIVSEPRFVCFKVAFCFPAQIWDPRCHLGRMTSDHPAGLPAVAGSRRCELLAETGASGPPSGPAGGPGIL